MTSRTPVRLTPHRGPLATPPTSPESSPIMSTPSTDIPSCSTSLGLDISILHEISASNSPTQHLCRSRLDRGGHKAPQRGLFGSNTQLRRAFQSLTSSARDLMNTIAGIAMFCLLIWWLPDWSSYAFGLPTQTELQLSVSRLPPPSRSRTFLLHKDPPLNEPGDHHVAVLQFLSEQIQHAKVLSSLSVDLGSPLRALFEAHRTTISSVVRHNFSELPPLQQVDPLANLTESLDSIVLEFTPGSFIGRSFTLALDELGGLASESVLPHRFLLRGGYSDVRLQAIYWRTTSNLLLEYSAARPRARRLLQHVRAVHRHLSPLVLGQNAAQSTAEGTGATWLQSISPHLPTTIDGRMQTLLSELEVSLDNLHRLIAYLDWITERLAQTTMKDVLNKRPATDFSSCLTSLQELFVRSWPPTPKRICFCWIN